MMNTHVRVMCYGLFCLPLLNVFVHLHNCVYVILTLDKSTGLAVTQKMYISPQYFKTSQAYITRNITERKCCYTKLADYHLLLRTLDIHSIYCLLLSIRKVNRYLLP